MVALFVGGDVHISARLPISSPVESGRATIAGMLINIKCCCRVLRLTRQTLLYCIGGQQAISSIMFKRSRGEPKADPDSTAEKCSFCGSDAVNMIEGAFPKAFCAWHYYTTRACRKKNVRLLNEANLIVEKEGCNVQELFADAFISLQSEIKEAAARYDPKDPLSLIQNGNDSKKTSFKQRSKEKKMCVQK